MLFAKPKYEALVGGQFLKHPYVGKYSVKSLRSDHLIMKNVPAEFPYQSEKYFMRSDDITVLADTDYDSIEAGLRMQLFGLEFKEKVEFYTALGHNVVHEYTRFPEAETILNGCDWAIRKINF